MIDGQKATQPLGISIKPKLNLQNLKKPAQNDSQAGKQISAIGPLKLSADKLTKLVSNKPQLELKKQRIDPQKYTPDGPLLKQVIPEAMEVKSQLFSSQLVPRKLQEFWLAVDVDRVFVPNSVVDLSSQERQAIVRVSLLERGPTGFWPLKKAEADGLATIPHENTTDIGNKTTALVDQILSVVTQPQKLCANGAFSTANSLLDAEQFAIGNSATAIFGGERLVINDKQNNVAENGFVLTEVVQLPTWQRAQERILAWNCVKLSELENLEGQPIQLQLFASPPGQGIGRLSDVMDKMFRNRPPVMDLEQAVENTAGLVRSLQAVYQPNVIGLVDFRFQFVTGDKITQERYTKSLPIYPYDVEKHGINMESGKDESQQQIETVVDFSKFDPKCKEQMDLLHQSSISTSISANQTTYKQNIAVGSFTSQSISAITSAPTGNTALGAAAVYTPSGVYAITLFNIVSGVPLVVLGCHYKYVYQLKFTANGLFLYSASADGTVMVFDVRSFVYYGFNYFFGKTQEQCNKVITVIQQKRKGEQKLDAKQEEAYRDFEQFIRQEAAIKANILKYQYGDFVEDIDVLATMTTVANEVALDLSQMTVQLSNETVSDLQQKYLRFQLDVGMHVFDCSEVNAKQPEVFNAKQIGLLHDTKIKRQFLPVCLELVTGNLSGRVQYYKITQNEKEKKYVLTQQPICQHDNQINAIKITQKLIISADNAGLVKLTSFEANGDAIQFRPPEDIQLEPGLRDLVLLKMRSNAVVFAAINSKNQIQIYDTQGQPIISINEQIQTKMEQKNICAQQKVSLTIGNCRMSTNADRSVCYAAFYGGLIVTFTPTGNILQSNYVAENLQRGCFVSQLHCSAFGLLCAFNVAVFDDTVARQMIPPGNAKVQSLPIFIQGGDNTLNYRKFSTTEQQDDIIEPQQKQVDGQQQPKNDEDVQMKMGPDGDLSKQLQDFLTFIKDSRARMKQ